MAEQTGSNAGIGLAIAILAGGLIVAPMLFFVGAFRGFGPNPGGAQASTQTISVAPDSPLKGELGDFERYTDAKQYLQKNTGFLDTVDQRLTSLLAKIKANDPAFKQVSAENMTKMSTTVVPEMIAQVNKIRVAVAGNNTADAAKAVNDFQDNLARLQRLAYTAGNLPTLASAIATENNDGHGTITYNSGGDRPEGMSSSRTSNGRPTFMDCSAFMTYVMWEAGVLPRGFSYTVATFYENTKNGKLRGFTMISDANDTPLPFNDLETLRTLGNLQPGDLILRAGQPLGKDIGRPHILMYVGGNDPAKAVVQSASRDGKIGPQFASFDELKRGQIRAVIRPGKAS